MNRFFLYLILGCLLKTNILFAMEQNNWLALPSVWAAPNGETISFFKDEKNQRKNSVIYKGKYYTLSQVGNNAAFIKLPHGCLYFINSGSGTLFIAEWLLGNSFLSAGIKPQANDNANRAPAAPVVAIAPPIAANINAIPAPTAPAVAIAPPIAPNINAIPAPTVPPVAPEFALKGKNERYPEKFSFNGRIFETHWLGHETFWISWNAEIWIFTITAPGSFHAFSTKNGAISTCSLMTQPVFCQTEHPPLEELEKNIQLLQKDLGKWQDFDPSRAKFQKLNNNKAVATSTNLTDNQSFLIGDYDYYPEDLGEYVDKALTYIKERKIEQAYFFFRMYEINSCKLLSGRPQELFLLAKSKACPLLIAIMESDVEVFEKLCFKIFETQSDQYGFYLKIAYRVLEANLFNDKANTIYQMIVKNKPEKL